MPPDILHTPLDPPPQVWWSVTNGDRQSDSGLYLNLSNKSKFYNFLLFSVFPLFLSFSFLPSAFIYFPPLSSASSFAFLLSPLLSVSPFPSFPFLSLHLLCFLLLFHHFLSSSFCSPPPLCSWPMPFPVFKHTHTHTHAPDCSRSSLHRLKLMVDPRACTPASLSIKPPLFTITHTHTTTVPPHWHTRLITIYMELGWQASAVACGGGEVGCHNGLPSPAGVADLGVDPHGTRQAPWRQTSQLIASLCRCSSPCALTLFVGIKRQTSDKRSVEFYRYLFFSLSLSFSFFPSDSISVPRSSSLLWCLSFKLTTAALSIVLSLSLTLWVSDMYISEVCSPCGLYLRSLVI